MAKKYHIQGSGAEAGTLVPCKAEISCRLGSESEHMYFATAAQANECSELLAAQDSGGSFGGGLSEKESQRLNELRAMSELNRAKDRPSRSGDLYLAPHTAVERFFHMEKRKGSNFGSRGSSPSTISRRVAGELEAARIGGFLPGATEVSASVKSRKLGKEILVEVTIPERGNSSDERDLKRRAAQIAESFTESSYSLVDSEGFSKRERVAGDKVAVEIRYGTDSADH